MAYQLPNPPGAGSSWEDGRSVLYTATMAGFASTSFGTQLGNWPGLTTTAGTLQTPTYSLANQVTSIPRESRRSAAGAAGGCGSCLATSVGNPNGVNFPSALNDAGFRVIMLGGIDVNVSTLTTSEFLFGVQTAGALFPSVAPAVLTQASVAWFGFYSLDTSSDLLFGFKNINGGIQNLVTSTLPASLWGTFQGFRLDVDFSPRTFPFTTKWKFQVLTSRNTFQTLTQGSTQLFTGQSVTRGPAGPCWVVRKNTAGDVIDTWISNVLIRSYYLGNFSL